MQEYQEKRNRPIMKPGGVYAEKQELIAIVSKSTLLPEKIIIYEGKLNIDY